MLRILSFLLIAATTAYAQNSNPLFNQLEFGDYKVGYQLIKAYDKARSPLKEQLRLPENQQIGRAIPIYFWYPASQNDGTMTFNNYLHEWAFGLNFEIDRSEIPKLARENFEEYYTNLSDSIIDQYFQLKITTMAVKKASPANGKFPVVTFNHGDIDRWWIWGEFLASHGIAVIGVPNAGTFQKRHEIGLSGLETQVRDMEFAISQVAEFEFIDTKSIVTAGSSYGSLTATALATRNRNVKGVISLDGIIADLNEGELLTKTPYFDYQLFDTPILHLHSGFSWSSNYILMDRMKNSNQYRIKMNGLRHSDYHFQGMTDLFGFTLVERETKNSSEGFHWVTQYVLNFIKGVTSDSTHLAFLKNDPTKNGVPEGLIEANFVEGLNETYSASDLLAINQEQGFDAVKSIYEKQKAKNPQPFSPATFFDFGLMLHRYNQIADEIIWFNYYLESFPKSAEAMYRLARLEALTGNEEAGKAKLIETKNLIDVDPHLTADRKIHLLNRIERFFE
ncbi:MAG: hypothetical protein RJQ09_03920 [Cyclobacteriaceae bacterium]